MVAIFSTVTLYVARVVLSKSVVTSVLCVNLQSASLHGQPNI